MLGLYVKAATRAKELWHSWLGAILVVNDFPDEVTSDESKKRVGARTGIVDPCR